MLKQVQHDGEGTVTVSLRLTNAPNRRHVWGDDAHADHYWLYYHLLAGRYRLT